MSPTPPASSKSLSGENYNSVVKRFEDAGFEQVRSEPVADSLIGVVNKPDEVISVKVGGSEDYATNDEYRIDTEVVVTYHAPVFGG